MTRSAPALLLPLALSALFAASGIALRGGPHPADPDRRPLPTSDTDVEGFNQAASGCAAGNARNNTAYPFESGSDYVPITTDDSLGFFVAYSPRTLNGTVANNNVGIFVFDLDGGEILIFGAGYGDNAAALYDAQRDATNLDGMLRNCMGRHPGNTPIRIVSPHWHGDHMNEKFVHALEGFGWSFVEILFHEDDDYFIRNYYNWSASDRAKFTVLPHADCNQEILSYPSPLGKIWFIARKGHAPGALDLVIDVRGNRQDRVLVLGSSPGGACPEAPDGTRAVVLAHGNVLLGTDGDVVPYGCGINPANSLVLLNGTPKAGSHVVLGVDDPTGNMIAGSLPYLWTSIAPDPLVPCGSLLDLPGMPQPGEVLLSLQYGDLITPPEVGAVWTGSGNPVPFSITVPFDPSLVGKSYYYQGALMDPFAAHGQRLLLTNALEFRIGP